MINQYEDFFALIDEEKINRLRNYYEKLIHDRKFISTWKNFYEEESEMMSYIRYYIEASDALLNKVNLCLQNYNEIRKEILGIMDVDSDGDITTVVNRIRTTAMDVDQKLLEAAGEIDDIQELFWNIWKIYDEKLKIQPLPPIPEPIVKKDNK
jgi:hypothetical protein